MFETYRMLGEQRELELLREAQRLHAGQAAKEGRVLRKPGSRLLSVLRRAVIPLISYRGSTIRASEKRPRSLLDP